MRGILRVVGAVALLLAMGCGTHQIRREARVDLGARWAMLPVINRAETPQAGERVEAIVAAALRAHGIEALSLYPASDEPQLAAFDDRRRVDDAMSWARAKGFTYGVSGTVTEWRYRSGLDGEPAVGVTLEVIDLTTGKVVYSASGARAGWGREPLSGAAQTLVDQLLSDLAER